MVAAAEARTSVDEAAEAVAFSEDRREVIKCMLSGTFHRTDLV